MKDRGDNPWALASGLSPVQTDRSWSNYFTTFINEDLVQREIFRAKHLRFSGNGGITYMFLYGRFFLSKWEIEHGLCACTER